MARAKKPTPMTPRQVRTRLAAACAGCLLAGLAAAGVFAALPAQNSVEPGENYGYVYSGAKSSSPDFIEASLSERSLVVFGSSEFSTPARTVPQVASQFYGENNYGLDLMLVGEAFDQSLWQAIALGALAPESLPGGKCVLIVSPNWFTDGGMDSETFGTRFSYSLYRGFCENASISPQTRAYVADRLAQMGVEQTKIDAAGGTMPQDVLNNLVFSALDDLSLRRDLQEVRDQGVAWPAGEETQPDWQALRDEALAYAMTRSTNNDWGLEDEFYERQLAPVLGSIEGYRAGETYSRTPEYDDLACFLAVARECGVEVMVVICPESGPYYDYIGIDAQTREGCYSRIREVCEEAGVQVADFSDREYEQYWLFDIVHFGWTGWIDLNQAIYEFAKGDRD